jgi:hypothetical protein
MTDEELAGQVTTVIDARVSQRIADTQRRREERRAEREQRTARRNAGLRARHAAKLARLAAHPMRQGHPMRASAEAAQ